METSLHRELKSLYAVGDAGIEVKLGAFRIDVVTAEQLIEIQHGSLAAIRNKVASLLAGHRVLVVKPIITTKHIVFRQTRDGKVVRRRQSPKRGTLLDIFHELIYFRQVFPREGLAIEVLLVDIEEDRYPGHGRRRRWRRNDHQVADQRLLAVQERHRLESTADLRRLVDKGLPTPFHTGHLATALGIDRWFAQRIAYCLRESGAAHAVGKLRGAILYQWACELPAEVKPRKRRRAA